MGKEVLGAEMRPSEGQLCGIEEQALNYNHKQNRPYKHFPGDFHSFLDINPYGNKGLLERNIRGRGVVQDWGSLAGGAEPPWILHTGGQGAGGTTHLVGGNDPLARMLEQLLIPPMWVLLRQLPGTQVVVAKPQQSQRLQEGLPVPVLGPKGCIHVEMVGGGGRR